ncbi:MAG: hypothetical protein RR060_07250, partial [Victivallaceae bacterium]
VNRTVIGKSSFNLRFSSSESKISDVHFHNVFSFCGQTAIIQAGRSDSIFLGLRFCRKGSEGVLTPAITIKKMNKQFALRKYNLSAVSKRNESHLPLPIQLTDIVAHSIALCS